ncbi:beta strand repeat-containing protein [Humisphaera borealis]|uniref:Autotransporter-associated beta strand repeat-containing protein n=1 Tax=Humisphaera borealis TaxID=2807512 RepID=A0A7M2WUR6_9BACT|nr:autotransporter-associated beta strand repeat-containing protein [Humisphaera borealis]QOV88280.1 autotransporter-associated beta strand repeat-containing protein [Humisphaera borealis]
MGTKTSKIWRAVGGILPALLTPLASQGQTTWNNGNSNFSWNDAANWSAGLPTSTALASFSNAGAGTITLDASQSALGLSFSNTTPYVFNSGTGTNTLGIFGSGIASNAAGAVTINPQITLGAAQTWALTSAGGSLTTGDVNLNAFGLTVGATNAAPININGVVSGTGTVSLAGGVVSLGSANTYSGTTTVTGGTLRTLVSGALPGTTTLAIPATAANGTVTVDLLGTSQTISNLTFNNTGATTVNFTGTAGSSLSVSPAALTLAPSVATVNLAVSMATLGTFTYNNAAGTFTANNGASANPANNAVTITLAGGTNNITASTINIGNGTTGGGVVNTTVNLGTTNTLKVDTIRFGNGRAGGNLKFATGLTNPTLTITGAAGGASTTNLNLGQGHDSNTLTTTPNDTFDTTLGTLTAAFNNVVIAQNVPAAGNRTIVFNSNFLMGAGSITANTFSVGVITQRATPTPASTLNSQLTAVFSLTGGTASIGTLTLATTNYTDTFTGTNTLSGTVNLNAGATLNATTIQRGATATPTAGTITITSQINWNDGTIGNNTGTDLGISGITLVSNGAAANHTFNISGAQTATVSSVISGAGPITKAGTGTLVYSGVNTLTGGNTVTAGTLRVSGSGTFGAATAPLTINGGLVDMNGQSRTVGNFNGAGGTIANNLAASTSTLTIGGTGTFNGTIANNTGTGGTLGLTKSGTGALTLGGTNTYTGTTNVGAGTLTIASSYPSGSALTLAAGATLSLNNGTTTPLTIPGLSLGAGTGVASLGMDLAAPGTNDSFGTAAAATTSNTVRFEITGLTGFAAGNYTLLSAASGLSTATYAVGAFPSGFSYTLLPSDTAVQINVFTIEPTTGPIFYNATSSNSWASLTSGNSNAFTTDLAGTTPAVGPPNSTNTVNFTTGGATIVGPTVTSVLDGNYTINDLVFNNQTQSGAVTAIAINAGNSASNTLTITPAAATAGINVQTGAPASIGIIAPVTLGANQTWTIADAPTVLTIGGAMNGTAGLTKNGPGTLRFLDSSFAGYTGAIAINAGAVNFEVTTGTQTVTSAVSGAGSVTKTGAGTVILNGANSYAGGTTIVAGSLNANSATAIGTGTLTINSGATLGNSSGNLVTFTNNNSMIWNGDFTKAGNSTTAGTGNVTMTANVNVNNTGATTFTVGGVISGAFSLSKSGVAGSVMALSGANTYSGGTTITGGVLAVNTLDLNGNASSIGTGTTLGINASTLRYTGAANAVTNRAVTLTGAAVIEMPITGVDQTLELSGVIDGTGALTKGVTGTPTAAGSASSNLILSNAGNTFSGNVTISAGTLTIRNSGGLGTGTKTITLTAGTAGAPSLRLDPGVGGSISLPSTISFSSSYNGQNALNPNGLGTIDSRTGNNTVAGNFTLMSGGGSTALNVSAGSTLTMSGNFAPNTTARALELRGDGTGVVSGLIADGSTTNILSVVRSGGGNGVWTLTNSNTYTNGTTVSGGTLLASNVSGGNSATGTGAVTVNGANGGGILGGVGSIAGPLTITTTTGTPGTLRPGDASANGTLTVLAGLTVNTGARLGFHIQNAGLPAAADTGGSTTGTLPNPTSNNFLNITGGTTSISSGTVLALDGTGGTFSPFATYSYQVGQGAGNQNLSITTPSQFVFSNFNVSPASATFTANSAGALYVNITFVPEPATLGLLTLAATGLLGRRRGSRRGRHGA